MSETQAIIYAMFSAINMVWAIVFLTDRFEYIAYEKYKKVLWHYVYDVSIQKLPNGRTFKVYADTLEFVTEEE
ncbi:MAG: hypothetical protein OEL89_00730 [Candidatus Peregrinibacteria bacterium]|nr:hypothetical protein [Candidatus Peregrinibacteria bacterium]